MSRRRRHNPCQTSLFHEIPAPARTRGQRIRIKQQWNETGRGDAEDAAEVVRGLMIERAEPKFTEFDAYMADVYGFKPSDSTDVWQRVMLLFFPEAFDADLDAEERIKELRATRDVGGLLPRMGGGKVTAAQIAAFAAVMKEGMERRK